MGLTVFNQFPQLTRLLARIARVAAHKETARPFVRINLTGGRDSLTDRAVNLVALSGGAATLALPELVPGESRHLDLRLEVVAEMSVTFGGNEARHASREDEGRGHVHVLRRRAKCSVWRVVFVILQDEEVGDKTPFCFCRAATSSRSPYHIAG